MSELIEFLPIDNEHYANLAGVHFDQHDLIPGEIIYGITHFCWKQFSKIKKCGKCILITSYSDGPVNRKMIRRLPSNVFKWFSNNIMTIDKRLEPLPLGFAFKRVHQEICLRLRKEGRPPQKNLMYMSFLRDIPRCPNPREGLYEMFGGLPWVTSEGGALDNYIPVEDFYKNIQRHPYILSPPGAGIDCHRHWESIALGSIPVVLRSQAVELLGDMPCLIVENWAEVTEDRLLRELGGLQERFAWPSMQKLDMRYWRERIQNEIVAMRNS